MHLRRRRRLSSVPVHPVPGAVRDPAALELVVGLAIARSATVPSPGGAAASAATGDSASTNPVATLTATVSSATTLMQKQHTKQDQQVVTGEAPESSVRGQRTRASHSVTNAIRRDMFSLYALL